jgi:hypothetical protein
MTCPPTRSSAGGISKVAPVRGLSRVTYMDLYMMASHPYGELRILLPCRDKRFLVKVDYRLPTTV